MEVVLMTPGIFVDAGGLILYIGADGKVHVKRILPWDPDVLREIYAAVHALEGVNPVRDDKVAKPFIDAAQRVVQAHVKQIQDQIGNALSVQ